MYVNFSAQKNRPLVFYKRTVPLCSRGYYYDNETGFYYLQSRYYDPEVCRFLNADVYVSTGQGITGYNMFAYCGNNPVNMCDCFGTCPHNGNVVELYNKSCLLCNPLNLNFDSLLGFSKKPYYYKKSQENIKTIVLQQRYETQDYSLIYSVPATICNDKWISVGEPTVRLETKEKVELKFLGEVTSMDINMVDYSLHSNKMQIVWDDNCIKLEANTSVDFNVELLSIVDINFWRVEITSQYYWYAKNKP